MERKSWGGTTAFGGRWPALRNHRFWNYLTTATGTTVGGNFLNQGGMRGKLAGYRWSSLSCYAKGKGPQWLEMERVLKSFDLAESGRGRRAYVDWLELRAANDGGNIDQTAQDALRRGWYLGEETFRDRLLDLVDKAKGVKARKRSRAECVGRDHGEKDAERLIRQCTPDLGLPADAAGLARLRKGDGRKAMLAALPRRRTTVGFEWIATRLQMGHPGSVSRQVSGVIENWRKESMNWINCKARTDPRVTDPRVMKSWNAPVDSCERYGNKDLGGQLGKNYDNDSSRPGDTWEELVKKGHAEIERQRQARN